MDKSYHFCLIDDELGLCCVRVPAWLPCRLRICYPTPGDVVETVGVREATPLLEAGTSSLE